MCGPYVILLDSESESESLGKVVIMLRKTSIVSDCVKNYNNNNSVKYSF